MFFKGSRGVHWDGKKGSGWRLATLIGFVSLVAGARAEDTDSQGWFQVLLNRRDTNGYRYFGELQHRFGNSWKNSVFSFVRGAVGKQLTRDFSFWVGYAWAPQSFPEWKSEDRYYLQGQWERNEGAWSTIQRTRLELRNIDDTGGSTYRLRHFLRATHPIATQSRSYFALQFEAFYNLERTGGTGPRTGYEQTRLYAGIGTNIAKSVRLEAGYQPVWFQLPSRRRLDTVVAVAIFNF